MPLSLPQISDRLEIQDLLVNYSYAIDGRDWEALDDIFTADAIIDYTETGGARGGLTEIKKFLADAMGAFAGSQHMVSTSQVTVDGNTASGRTMCHNPLISSDENGMVRVLFSGFWYRDAFVRTGEGWRIEDRYQERGYLLDISASQVGSPP